jgi:ubiquinone/menaquinone biosynthesis C-methylase UbiE
MSDRPSDKSRKSVETYDRVATQYAKAFQEPSEHIDDFLELLKTGDSILDIGCGPGIDADHMRKKGFIITGVDLSESMIALAKKKYPEIVFRVQDMRKLDFPPAFFEGAFVAYSLIHLSKKEVTTTLKRICTLLKPRGVLYVAVQGGKSGELELPEPLDPSLTIFLNVFTTQEISRVISQAGFTIVQIYERPSQKAEEFAFSKLFLIARKEGRVKKSAPTRN